MRRRRRRSCHALQRASGIKDQHIPTLFVATAARKSREKKNKPQITGCRNYFKTKNKKTQSLTSPPTSQAVGWTSRRAALLLN